MAVCCRLLKGLQNVCWGGGFPQEVKFQPLAERADLCGKSAWAKTEKMPTTQKLVVVETSFVKSSGTANVAQVMKPFRCLPALGPRRHGFYPTCPPSGQTWRPTSRRASRQLGGRDQNFGGWHKIRPIMQS